MNDIRLLIASNNAHKLKEIREILGSQFGEIISLAEAGIKVDPDETGETFYDNARIKVDAIAQYAPEGYAILADDSGLCVDALDGAPGVHSARFAGEHGDDAKNIAKLLSELAHVSDPMQRTARFVCCVVLRLPNGAYLSAEGKTEGRILFAPEGKGGFGYDPVFYSFDLNVGFGAASASDKNAVSHRGRALRSICDLYEEYRHRQ